MKQTKEELDASIDALLADWHSSIEIPQGFRREVWRRVELEEPCRNGLFERLSWWLLRPLREVVVLVLVIVTALIWGLTHPDLPRCSPHDAYLRSISPFAPEHYRISSR
jgi:hypothetical protein